MVRGVSGEFAGTWLNRGLDYVRADELSSFAMVAVARGIDRHPTLGLMITPYNPDNTASELNAVTAVDRVIGHFAGLDVVDTPQGRHKESDGLTIYGNRLVLPEGVILKAATIADERLSSPSRQPTPESLAQGYQIAHFIGSVRSLFTQCAINFDKADVAVGTLWTPTGNPEEIATIRAGIEIDAEEPSEFGGVPQWQMTGKLLDSDAAMGVLSLIHI